MDSMKAKNKVNCGGEKRLNYQELEGSSWLIRISIYIVQPHF